MIKELQELYLLTRRLHQAAFNQMVLIERKIKSFANKEEAADAVYALKQVVDLFDDSRKEAQRRVELAEKVCCMIWMSDPLADGEPIRTPFCTASPEVAETPKTPKPGTPEYNEFCAFFNVDPNTPFRPHWPSILEAAMKRLREGLPSIPGCNPNDVWTVFKVATRKKAPIVSSDIVPDATSLDALKRAYERDEVLAMTSGDTAYWDATTIEKLHALVLQAKQDRLPVTNEQEVDNACPF